MTSSPRLMMVLALAAACECAAAGEAPAPAAFECEHAKRLRGPAWVRRDGAASRVRCVELMGERASALLEVRVRQGAEYTAWARARSATGEPAAVSLRMAGAEDQDPLNAAVDSGQWGWVRLGPLRLHKPGLHALRVGATGTVRLDQLLLSLEPGHEPEGVRESSASRRFAEPEIYRADDFMRSKREAGPWETVSGKWVIQELKVRDDLGRRTGRHFDPTRSANAFSYIGTGTQAAPALAITGYPSWRNYSFEAAVRSPHGGVFGLAILRQDADNYYLLRCDLPGRELELIRCLDGICDRLACRRGALRANQWYHLRLAACDGELSVHIDGRPVLEAVDHTFLSGQPGLWSADEQGAYFDDVLLRGYHTVVERFGDGAASGWEPLGKWRAVGGGVVGVGTLLYREPFGDFEVVASLGAGSGEAGLAFDWRDEAHHALLVVRRDPRRVELREVADGKATLLDATPLPPAEGPGQELRLTQAGGRVRAWVGDRLVAGACRPASGTGRVGLFAAGGPARFERVALGPAQSPPPNRVHNRIFAGEDTMAAWASAGSDWQLTTAAPRSTAWHEIEHWGDCAVRYEFPAATALPGKLGFVVRGDGKAPGAGYQLVAQPQPKGPPTLTLLRDGKPVGTAKAPAPTLASVELRWRARSAVAVVDGKPLLWHRAAAAPPGRRVAIWSEGWQPELASTHVESTNLVDDYFEAASVDWRAESGEWLMQNRWTCSPQWSWLGGSSPDAAMLWRKRAYRGDVALHLFAAFQMKKRHSRIYRPAELNLTICGDGRNPASGYTLIYGGWLNTATALLRRGKVVARTTKEALRPPSLLDTTPSTNFLHRKWWHIAIEKHGPKVSCYVDDQLALEYTDPEPLDGGSVCLWTYDNSVMIARAWIAYEAEGARDLPLELVPQAPELPPPPVVASSHGGAAHDFESGLGKWAGTPGSSTVGLESRGDGLALAVTNPRAGGAFELAFPIEPFYAMKRPRLTFDYRMPPDAKVNLHVKARDRVHAIHFTDPQAYVAGIPILGRIDAQADGAWHTADVDLRALLLRCYPAATELPVQAIALSTRNKRDYLSAGFGGNGAGVTYRLDNVRLWSPGPPEATFSWDPKLAASYVLDREPATVPDDTVEQGNACRRTGLADGAWFFHLKARRADGGWSRVAHRAIVVDATRPLLAASSPAGGAKSPAHTVTVDLADESGIDPKSLVVTLLGKPQAVQVVPSDPMASYTLAPVRFDPVLKRLSVNLAALPLSFDDGAPIRLTVASGKDFLGHAMQPCEINWVYDRAGDKQPPTQLRLEGSHLDLCRDDFETGLGEWAATPNYAIVERDTSTAATGRYSLRIHNPYSGGPFSVTARASSFDVGRYPIVSFDYKMPPNVRTDLLLTIDGTAYTVRFTDPAGTNCIGAIPEVKADGQWHHTEFNLHEIVASAIAHSGSYIVTKLQFADTGFYGNADGVEYHLDNFTISPATSTRQTPLQWKLAATDPSGIGAWQYSLSAMPAGIKWHTAKSPTLQFRSLGAGIFHFLVRARDGAGNWSEPLRRQILVDDKPPAIQAVHPKPGGRAARSRIQVALADTPAGIDRDKTSLTVAGTTYSAATEGVTYDARTQSLVWNGPELPKPVCFANGQKVAVKLSSQDNVGNAATRQWTWTMDYALDKTPPPVPYVTRVPGKSLSRSTFETNTGTWADYSKYGSVSRVATTAATGRYSLRVRALRSRTYFGAYAYRKSYNAATHPIISFDYKIPPGVRINLHVHVGSWKTIKLTSTAARYTPVGAVPLTPDNKWHHAEIDLLRFLKPTTSSKSKTPRLYVRYVLFADWATRSARAGTCYYIDNFAISAPENGGQKLQFEWSAVKDGTGVAGYAYTFGKSPTSLPTELKGTGVAATIANPGPGAWFFHLRARDGAGNWGPAVHFPVTIPTRTAAVGK